MRFTSILGATALTLAAAAPAFAQSAAGQYGAGPSTTGQAPSGQSGMGSSTMGSSPMGQAPSGQSGMGSSGMGSSTMGHPSAGATAPSGSNANTTAGGALAVGLPVKDKTGVTIGQITDLKPGAGGQTATVKMGNESFAIGAQSFVVQNGAAVINATQSEIQQMITNAKGG